jgi:K+-transporting ATPase KdpF subunit
VNIFVNKRERKPCAPRDILSLPCSKQKIVMKRNFFRQRLLSFQSAASVLETATDIWTEWRRKKLPLYLFLGLCFNVVLAPAVFAATVGDLSKVQAYWLAGLGLVTVALSIYLFFVMFVPEKF